MKDMQDMLVKLYDLPETVDVQAMISDPEVRIVRPLSPDRDKVLAFVREAFDDGWANECAASLCGNTPTCYIAVKNKKIIGFACYDATAKNFFGPTGVAEHERGTGVGKALLYKCLLSMREEGYAYAMIGWVDTAKGFYEKTVHAIAIPDTAPGVYSRLVGADPD